ncbi:MAG: TetR/AcrR family transcriptional regulator [Bradyrhizobiaceae bacterium]|nr:TetR/AcrR family transcriptional regulator [Bradyrhizobiaceae bacterium]
MSRPAVQRQTDRREEILAAAQRCFARSGFHQSSMQEICAEAEISPGGLYRYFPSKEAIIAAITERDRADAADNFAAVANVPGIFEGLEKLARHYLIERPTEEINLCAEIRTESRRNPEIGRIHHAINTDVEAGLVGVLRKAAERGEIPSDLDLERIVVVLLALGDGLEWRRAAEPDLDIEPLFPYVMQVARCLLSHAPDRQPKAGKETSDEG